MIKNIINPKNLLYLSVFLMPLYLIKIKFFLIPTNIIEILILAAFILWIFRQKDEIEIKKFFIRHKKFVLLVVLIFLGLAVSSLNGQDYQKELGIIKGWFIVPLVFSFLTLQEIKNKKEAEKILQAFYFSALSVGIIGIAYLLAGNLTYDFRLKAFYLSPNHLAMFLAPAVFAGAYLTQNQKSKIKNQNDNAKYKISAVFYLLSSLMIIAVLYLTYSYAAWLAVTLSFGIIFLIKKKIRPMAILIALIIILLITQINNAKLENLKNYTRSSLESRIIIWKSAGKIVGDNLIFGIGPGNFQNKYLEYQKQFPLYLEWAVPQPHNLFLAFWLQSGILGLIGFLLLMFFWIKEILKMLKNEKSGSFSLGSALLGIMLYILIHGLVDTPYWKNDLAIVFWLVFSLGIILRNRQIRGAVQREG